MKLLFNLWTARGLVIVGFLAAYTPVGSTFAHIGNEEHADDYLLDTQLAPFLPGRLR